MAQVTSPILLDSTGQQIVTKLQTIADNVKPTADEIKMTSLDATTVKAKIDSLNSQLVTVVENSLTPKTGVTINMQRKIKIGKLVAYNLVITTTEQTQYGASLVSGFEGQNGGYNGVPTILSYNNNNATAMFYIHNTDLDLRPIAAFGAGTWRMSFSYICL